MKLLSSFMCILISSLSHAGEPEITFHGSRASYNCKATMCFKKDLIQNDLDIAAKDADHWCKLVGKGGEDACKYFKEKTQAIKQCSSECIRARCTKQNLTTRECLVGEFR